MLGHFQDVLSTARTAIQGALDDRTASLTPEQKELANAVAGAVIANLAWKSDTNPNQEKKYAIPTCGQEVAGYVALQSASFAARTTISETTQVNDILSGVEGRALPATVKLEIDNLLARRARGQ